MSPFSSIFAIKQLNIFYPKKIHPKVIVAKRFNRNWPKEIRYGTHKYFGLKLTYFKIEQRLRNIHFLHKLITHLAHQKLVYILIEWYQV